MWDYIRYLISILAGSAITVYGETWQVEKQVTSFQHTSDPNQIVDSILSRLNENLFKDGKSEVSLGNLKRNFTTKVLLTEVNGEFQASQGRIGDFSSLKRIGEATLKKDNEDNTIMAHLGMQKLNIEYGNYYASSQGVSDNGEIKIYVDNNLLSLKITIVYKASLFKTKCLVDVTDFKIEEFDNFFVDFTKIGVFGNAVGKFTSWVLDEVSNSYQNHVEKEMYPCLVETVNKLDLCQHF